MEPTAEAGPQANIVLLEQTRQQIRSIRVRNIARCFGFAVLQCSILRVRPTEFDAGRKEHFYGVEREGSYLEQKNATVCRSSQQAESCSRRKRIIALTLAQVSRLHGRCGPRHDAHLQPSDFFLENASSTAAAAATRPMQSRAIKMRTRGAAQSTFPN